MRRALLALAAAGALATGGALPAQTPAPARRSATNAHAWLQLFGEHRLDARWALSLEAQLRRADVAGATPQQLLLRPGNWSICQVRCSGKGAAAGASPYTAVPAYA